MSQQPQLFISLVVYGDLKSKITAENTSDSVLADITQTLRIEPSEASCNDDILVWEHKLEPQHSWELAEVVFELLELLPPSIKVVNLLQRNGLTAEVKAAAYVTDSYPAMSFPASLLHRFGIMGLGLDIDVFRTAYPENRDLI